MGIFAGLLLLAAANMDQSDSAQEEK